MFSPLHFFSFVFYILLAFFSCSAQISTRPRTLFLPVTKDAATNQFLTVINQRTPLVPLTLAVDLGGKSLWVDCDNNYVSSTYHSVRCRSAQCSLAGNQACGNCFNGPRPGCNNNTCGISPENPFTRTSASGEVAQDVVVVRSTNGPTLYAPVATVSRYIFGCGPTFLLEGLANGATGVVGLGRGRIGAPSLFAAAFSLQRTFFVCLSPFTGAIFFGDGAGTGILGSQFSYTPLHINPVSTAGTSFQGEPSTEYFVRINAIRINDKPISINNTLVTIDSNGNGGTKISTVNPYTILETSIYREFTTAYIREAAARNISRVAGVAPFEVCFDSTNAGSGRLGPDQVPTIDLVFQGENAAWRIFGVNSMVSVNDDVLCLGFQDGGVNPRTSIVIGTFQLEDNLVMFDLARSRMGFTGTLLHSRTTCGEFDFTSRG